MVLSNFNFRFPSKYITFYAETMILTCKSDQSKFYLHGICLIFSQENSILNVNLLKKYGNKGVGFLVGFFKWVLGEKNPVGFFGSGGFFQTLAAYGIIFPLPTHCEDVNIPSNP